MDTEQFAKHAAWVARFPEKARQRIQTYRGFWSQFLDSEGFNYSATKVIDASLLLDTLAAVREGYEEPPAPPLLTAPAHNAEIIEGVEPATYRFTPIAETREQIEANFAALDAWVLQLEEYAAGQQAVLAGMEGN